MIDPETVVDETTKWTQAALRVLPDGKLRSAMSDAVAANSELVKSLWSAQAQYLSALKKNITG